MDLLTGVSLETQKWVDVLKEKECEVYYISWWVT
jgi:hypothetical protein